MEILSERRYGRHNEIVLSFMAQDLVHIILEGSTELACRINSVSNKSKRLHGRRFLIAVDVNQGLPRISGGRLAIHRLE